MRVHAQSDVDCTGFFVAQGETATGRSMEACPQKAGQHTGCVPKIWVSMVKTHMKRTEDIKMKGGRGNLSNYKWLATRPAQASQFP